MRWERGELENRVRKAAAESLNDGKARTLEYNMADPSRGDPGVCGGQVEVFVEPILPTPTVYIFGAGLWFGSLKPRPGTEKIDTLVSLGVIVLILATSVVWSLLKPKKAKVESIGAHGVTRPT